MYIHPPFLLRGGVLNKNYRGKKIRGNQMSEFYIIKHAIATNFYLITQPFSSLCLIVKKPRKLNPRKINARKRNVGCIWLLLGTRFQDPFLKIADRLEPSQYLDGWPPGPIFFLLLFGKNRKDRPVLSRASLNMTF